MKRFVVLTFCVILHILISSHFFCLILSSLNFQINTKIWNELNIEGVINFQNNCKDMNYGLGNVPDNGCGAVAVYNIMVLENKDVNFPEVVKYFDNSNECLFGILGTNPFAMRSYLENEGFDVDIFLKQNNIKEEMKSSKYSIIMYFNLSGGHFQLFKDYDGKYAKSYNPSGTYDMDKYFNWLKSRNKITLLITVN